MAGSSATLDWGGFDRAVIAGIAKLADSRQQLNADIGESLVTSVKLRFKAEEGPDGTKWEQSKRAAAEDGKTLSDSTGLKGSIGYEATTEMVVVGTAKEYGRIHQKGGQAGKNKSVTLPARPFLGITEDDIADATDIFRDFFAESLP